MWSLTSPLVTRWTWTHIWVQVIVLLPTCHVWSSKRLRSWAELSMSWPSSNCLSLLNFLFCLFLSGDNWWHTRRPLWPNWWLRNGLFHYRLQPSLHLCKCVGKWSITITNHHFFQAHASHSTQHSGISQCCSKQMDLINWKDSVGMVMYHCDVV